MRFKNDYLQQQLTYWLKLLFWILWNFARSRMVFNPFSCDHYSIIGIGKVLPFHCMKSVHIQSYFGLYFTPFRLNTERYSVLFHIQVKYKKIWTRITPNRDIFFSVFDSFLSLRNLLTLMWMITESVVPISK